MRGYAAVGLYQPRNNVNVGSVLRAAGCFDTSLVVVEGRRYSDSSTDTMKSFRHIPLVQGSLRDSIPFGCIPIAVDLIDGAKCLHSYWHPERAFYIFGPEDGTIPKDVQAWCRDAVYMPTQGCLNLAAAVNIVLYDRQMKRARYDQAYRRERGIIA